MTVSDVRGFADEDQTGKKFINNENTPKGLALPVATSSSDLSPWVDDLDLSHLSPERHSLVREMPSNFNFM